MIANPTPDGWEILYQPAHALLSAQIAGYWRAAARPPRWDETLVAVAQHDNGWKEWEELPRLTEAGAPVNFTEMALPDAIEQWHRGVARGYHQSSWVGLLISIHGTALYEVHRGKSEALDRFLDEQHAQQKRWIDVLGASEEEIRAAYAMVRWTDWFSLVLGWRRVPADGTPVDVGEGPDGISYAIRQRPDDTLTVEPWPFDPDSFTLTTEARHVAHHTFADSAALAAALAAARPAILTWRFSRQ